MTDLSGWHVVISNGKTLVGHKSTQFDTDFLSPVYELLSGVTFVKGDDGVAKAARPVVALPVCGFASLLTLAIPAGCIMFPVAVLDEGERSALTVAIEAAGQLRDQMRAGIGVTIMGSS